MEIDWISEPEFSQCRSAQLTVKSVTSFAGSSSSSFSAFSHSPASTPFLKSVTVLDSRVNPDSAERESAVSLQSEEGLRSVRRKSAAECRRRDGRTRLTCSPYL